jgi:transcriptional regulator with XRE-family HTH domain
MSQYQSLQSTNDIFSMNFSELMSRGHSIASLSRDLDIQRTQLCRFLNGQSIPRPDALLRICRFFDVDARILTHRLAEIPSPQNQVVPCFITDALDPVPQGLFPDGFFEEWRELATPSKQYACHLYHVTTHNGIRHTKAFLPDVMIGQDGALSVISVPCAHRGFAIRQAGGISIMDRHSHNTGLTFTALKLVYLGGADLFAGHKRSVASVVTNGHVMKSATVMRRLAGGFREAMVVRREPWLRTTQETPELMQWLLKEQQRTVELG